MHDELEAAKGEMTVNVERVIYRLNTFRNPVSGQLDTFENVLTAMVELHREEALTAEGYEELDIPSAWHEVQQVVAYLYDMEGKKHQTGWNKEISDCTAFEYDQLELNAEKYSNYSLMAAEYDLMGKTLLV